MIEPSDSLPPAPVTEPAPAQPVAGTAPKERDIFGREPVGYQDWSHRRGEPRVFALVWMIFLMAVTAMMFAALSPARFISPQVARPAAQAMILATVCGLALFWPAVRLSQRPADRPLRSVLQDMFVLLVPAQAVIWPHAMSALASWSWAVLTAVAAVFAAWSIVIGGLLACADVGPRAGRGRGVWMLVVLAVVFASPVTGVVTRGVSTAMLADPRPGWMLSPLTAVLEVTRDRSATGTPRPVSEAHWRLIGATGCVGLALFCVAAAGGVASRRRGA